MPVYLPFPGITIVASVVSRECATRDRRLRLVRNSDLYATVSPRRPISRRRRDAFPRTPVFPPLRVICSADRPPNCGRHRYTRVLIDYVARDELENYARSEDALGESTVDRPRRLEIVDDPHTIPAILQGRLHHQIPFYQGCRFVLIDLRRKICRKSEEDIARERMKPL